MTIYSYSRVNTFFTCPAQFQFRYIERRPSPVAEGIELFLGSRFHETMEYLYQQLPMRTPTVNEMVDYFKKHWNNHWQDALQKQREKGFKETLRIVQEGPTVEDYFQKGLLFTENYYHQYHPFDQDQTEGIELKVAFNLDPKGRYKMQGFIDRLGRDSEGTLWIHDYKTSSRKMSQEDAKTEDQLALYQLGLSQNPHYGPKEEFRLAWHFVAFEKDQVVSERSPKDIERLKERYISKIETIEKSKNYPTKTGVLCQWCEYLTVCSDGQKWVENRKKNMPAPADSEKSKMEPASLSPAPSPATPILEVSQPATISEMATSKNPKTDFGQVSAQFSSSDAQKGSGRKRKTLAGISPDQLSLF